jgi:phosphoribosyl-ATP pyrophosphohydrolase
MSKEKFSNQLTDAEIERLAILAEECAEVQQVVMKILRHGYESYHPKDTARKTNRKLLATEIGDLQYIITLMEMQLDVSSSLIQTALENKEKHIKKYLHHQTKLTP